MNSIQDYLPGKIKTARQYSEAELESARRRVAQRNSICSVDCPICGGRGFVQVGDGKIEPCPNVDPLTLYPGERYGLTEAERGATWADVVDYNNVWDGVRAVQSALLSGWGWVYIWGPPGLGKTLILKIAVAEYLRNKHQAAYIRMAEILDDLRGAFDARNPSEESQARLNWWSSLPLLAIDEFDRVNGTDWSAERRFLLMDRRYEQALRERSITLLTSNTDPAKLDGYLFDRIQDGRFKVVHVAGDSFRPGVV